MSSSKDPSKGDRSATIGYDINHPIPGLGGMTVAQARDVAGRAAESFRDERRLPRLTFSPVAMYIAQNESTILGQRVARDGSAAYRLPNTKNWASNYPELTQQPWWNDSVQPATVVWRSSRENAPASLLRMLHSSGARAMLDSRYTHAGVGVWRNPSTGEWFFVYALLP